MSRSPERKPVPAELDSQTRLVEALTTLVRTLVGSEIEGVSHRLDELDASLSRRIADLAERVESMRTLGERIDACASRAEAVERAFERDLRPRIEALDRLVGEVDERLARRIREATKIEQDLRAGHDELRERIGSSGAELAEKLRNEVAKQHESHDDLVERVQGLTESMNAVQKAVEQQLETSERLSTVLNTLTSVFTTQRTAAIAAGQPGARSADPATGTTSDTSLGDLDSVLNKLFPR